MCICIHLSYIYASSIYQSCISCSSICHLCYLCIHLHVYVYLCLRAPFFSCVQLPVTPWAAAHQAPLSMGLSRQEDWSGLPCPPPGDLPNPGIKPAPLTSPALAGVFCTTRSTWEAHVHLRQRKSFSRVQLFATPWTVPIHGILQARILEWVAVPFSRGSSQSTDQTQVFHIAGGFVTS